MKVVVGIGMKLLMVYDVMLVEGIRMKLLMVYVVRLVVWIRMKLGQFERGIGKGVLNMG